MTALHPEADIKLNLGKRSACDPKQTFVAASKIGAADRNRKQTADVIMVNRTLSLLIPLQSRHELTPT